MRAISRKKLYKIAIFLKYFPLFFLEILSTIGARQRWTAADSRRRVPLHFMVPGGQKKEE
ncbi:MAG TPA: hypothetical protein DIT21_08140 [Oscillibacter sp.]|nr:hypothetical protein [Oscillibacter sp.]